MKDMKNSLDGFDRRSDTTEEKIIELKDIVIKTIQSEAERKKTEKRNEQSLSACETKSSHYTYS